MRSLRRGAHRNASGKVAVRPGRVLQRPISQSADEVRQAAAEVALAKDGIVTSKFYITKNYLYECNIHMTHTYSTKCSIIKKIKLMQM